MGEHIASGGEFAVTEAAARKVAELIAADGRDGIRLRVQVLGGGCSGFQYDFRFDEDKADDDLIFERDGVEVLVDPVSIEYLKGSQFDYVEEMIGSSFQVNHPNATASCGCRLVSPHRPRPKARPSCQNPLHRPSPDGSSANPCANPGCGASMCVCVCVFL